MRRKNEQLQERVDTLEDDKMLMNEKRFKLSKYVTPSSVSNFCDENGKMLNKEVVKVLNEQQATIDMQELRLQQLEEILELSENLNKKYREKLIDMNLKMVNGV